MGRKILNDANVVQTFKDAAINNIRESMKDSRLANKNYNLVIKAALYLKNTGQIEKLLPLLQDTDDEVKIWSSTILLTSHEEHAIKALNEVISKKYNLSVDAEIILNQWNKGELNYFKKLGF